MELGDEIYKQVQELGSRGSEFMDRMSHDNAIAEYEKALALLPEPKSQWDEYSWLCAGIADGYYYTWRYEDAFHWYTEATKAPYSQSDSYLQLRLGNCAYRLDRREAVDYFLRAYLKEGRAIFVNEPDFCLGLLEEEGLLED